MLWLIYVRFGAHLRAVEMQAQVIRVHEKSEGKLGSLGLKAGCIESAEPREVCVMLPAVPACGQPLPSWFQSKAAGFQAISK